jgi:hypothetical protein
MPAHQTLFERLTIRRCLVLKLEPVEPKKLRGQPKKVRPDDWLLAKLKVAA